MTSNGTSKPIPDDVSAQIQIHRGAIDQTTITTQPPASVMQNVHAMLLALGVSVQMESTFRFRCIRPRKTSEEDNTDGGGNTTSATAEFGDLDGEGSLLNGGRSNTSGADERGEEEAEDPKTPTQMHPQLPPSSPPSPTKPPCSLYGPTTSDDPAGEVRFSIELTKLAGLSDTYSLDIRRLKGHLRSYKYIYDTLRDRAELNR